MINEKEFDLLKKIAENCFFLSTNKENKELLNSLKKLNYIDNNNSITKKGYKKLQEYKVDNAIILAAGMATRFVPFSYEKPKGLMKVKGEPLIERLICQLKEKGINEIVIVVGYMKESFYYLKEKYDVIFVVNNEFHTKNTYSSIYFARKYMKNSLIICADNYYPENLFNTYEYNSYYCGVYLPGVGETERSLVPDETGLVITTHKPSVNEWIMIGHAYWNKDFSSKFKKIIEDYYKKIGYENYYWETVWAENLDKCKGYLKKCTKDQILEFDSVEDIKKYDCNFYINNKSTIIKNICNIFKCDFDDLKEFIPLTTGLNNKSFTFEYAGNKYVYRHPGINAEGYIDRKKEAFVQEHVKKLGIDSTLVYIDKENGWKISKFIDSNETFDFSNMNHIKMLANHLKKLHESKLITNSKFSYMIEADKLLDIIENRNIDDYNMLEPIKEKIQLLANEIDNDSWQVSLCHNDIYQPNIIVESDKKIHLIDWEFSGDNDIGFDICKLFAVSGTNVSEIDNYLYYYYGRKTTTSEKKHLIGCSAISYYYWYVWGIYASENGTTIPDYLKVWYDKMNIFLNEYYKIGGRD